MIGFWNLCMLLNNGENGPQNARFHQPERRLALSFKLSMQRLSKVAGTLESTPFPLTAMCNLESVVVADINALSGCF